MEKRGRIMQASEVYAVMQAQNLAQTQSQSHSQTNAPNIKPAEIKEKEPITIRIIKALALAIVILLMMLVFTIIFGFSFWLNMYKAFTKETPVAKITVSALEGDSEKNPHFKLEYTEIPGQTAFTRLFNGDVTPNTSAATYEYEINGDRFGIEAEVVVLDNWAYLFNPGRLIGTDTVYKMTRVKGEFSDIDLANSGDYTVYELNGGADDFWKWMEMNQEDLPFVKSVYGSAIVEFVRDEDREWIVYMTEDGLGVKLDESESK